jgi:LacI family transcriptional regulator
MIFSLEHGLCEGKSLMSSKTTHSIVEVARLADVSVTTVSRVLSGSSYPVSQEKRDRVMAAAATLNYSPSALAKAMVTRDTRIVGVIIGDATDPYFATIVRGVEDAAREHGYLVIVCNSDRNPEVEISYLKTLNDYRVDGIIFAGGGLDDPRYISAVTEILKIFQDRGSACVSLARQHLPSFAVRVDNHKIVRDAVSYLVDLGHTRIAYISGPGMLTTTRSRLEGYQQAVVEFGLDQEAELIIDGDYTSRAGCRAAIEIHRMINKPSAVLASNDLMAIGCMVGLKELGYQIPGDFSLIGIDDIAFAQFVDPPLTTVCVPMYDLGRIGMENLIALRKAEIPKMETVILPHHIVVRKSVAAFRNPPL